MGERGVPVITIEDGMRDGGLGSAVAEWMADHDYHTEIIRIGVPDRFVAHGKVPELMRGVWDGRGCHFLSHKRSRKKIGRLN